MNQSIERFIAYAAEIERFAREVVLDTDTIREFKRRTNDAERIYVTGTGTSLPTALYLTAQLQQKCDKLVIFLPTGKMIRQIPRLRRADLVIMISHSFNRADARIIYDGVREKTDTIVVTGNTHAEVANKTLLISLPPEVEKIFCRPISPVTTLLALRQLLAYEAPKDLPKPPNVDELVSWIDPEKQTILLHTAGVSFGAELWGIVLREGAGLNVLTKDVENYSHGYYGVDTAHLAERQYIIVSSDSPEDTRDLARADGLYSIRGFDKREVIVWGGEFEANLELFLAVPKVVEGVILRTGRDMDHPNGMEENRKYHEYDRYPNYL